MSSTQVDLGKQWSWVRENPADWSLSKNTGSLVLTSANGDIQGATNNAENILLQSANTDWTIDSKLVFSRKPSGFSQNGGLLAYQDDDNYIKLVYSAGGGDMMSFFGGIGGPGAQSGSILLVKEENGNQTTAATLSMANIIKDNNTLFLKFEKKGSLYSASCSSDGKNFKTIGSTNIMLNDIKAGIMVCNGVPDPRFARFIEMVGIPLQQKGPETPFKVSYDYFHITNRGLK